MSSADPSNTVTITLTPNTLGSSPPNLHDDSFAAAIQSAKAGGAATQSYFDASNQTADYWTWLTDTVKNGDEPWAEGTDPDGNPIQMSSNGNLDVRMGAFYRGPDPSSTHQVSATDAAPVVGLATIETYNTTSSTGSTVSFWLSIGSIPAGIVLTKKLFADLVKPVYSNLKTAVNKLATKFREEAEVEDPDIDPESEAEDPLDDASDAVEEVAGDLAEEGAEYAAVSWGSVVGEMAGIGVLTAIPLIVSYLGHKMRHSVVIHNLTGTDLTWSLTQVYGTASVLPDPKQNNTIPKMNYNLDHWGDRTTVKCSYEASMQFINSNDYSSIGWVLGLTPADGNPKISVVGDIPWAGDNIVWTGQDSGNDQAIYDKYTNSAPRLSVSATVGAYKSTVSINALQGETEGAYFYGTVIVIEPA